MALGHDAPTNEFKIDQAPDDCIQSVKFGHGKTDNQYLLVASWDCTTRLYDINANQLRVQYTHDAPVLDASFQGNNVCWSGGADNIIKKFDFQSQTETVVGYHTEPVKCVEYIPETNLVATGGWDCQLKFWDPRKPEAVFNQDLEKKVYSMSACGDKVIVGMSDKSICVWDLRNMKGSMRETILKFQIRCIETCPDKKSFVVGSIEGRVAVEYLDDDPEVQKKKYAFKCHRNKDPTTNMEIIYPVNSISFHRTFNTFATGGSDGFVSIWDGKNKKRLVQFHKYPNSISSLSFSPDGTKLAIACSNLDCSDDSEILRDTPLDSIFVRNINENEVRNKS